MIKFGAEVKSVRKLTNGTMDVILNTQIQTPSTMAELFTMQDYCYAMLKSEQFSHEDEEQLAQMKATAFGKTPSQRLRNTLYVRYQQDNGGFKDFTDFYAHYIENFINLIKEQLN